MSTRAAIANANGADLSFEKLVDDLLNRLQTGEAVDWSAVERDHPVHADRLRSLAPALAALGELSRAGYAAVSGVAPTGGDVAGVLGDYRIIREVGRGGMGIVYEALQISLNRPVALKVLPFAATMDPRQLQRFRHEAQAAALLHHPNIVPVHGVGCERGVHYYAMQLIEGRSLAAVIDDFRLPIDDCKAAIPAHTAGWSSSIENHQSKIENAQTAPVAALSTQKTRRNKAHYRRLAELTAQAADALEYAHSMGVVHRDVKPGNLLLDEGGNLWVTDFGLAKLDTAVGMTMSGDLLGTLRYMSPEQALARHGLVDHRTDVYSLGATLYELLTLRPAVDGKDKADILRHLAFEEPLAPRKLDKAIPAELETITLKCLAKNPAERYATAAELAADLRRFVEDKPIKARRPTVLQRFGWWARRHPAVTASIGLIAGLVIAGIWAWHRETNYADAAARGVAVEAGEFLHADRLPEALLAARRAADLLPRFGGDADLRREVNERVADLQLLNRLEEARGEMAAVRGVRFDLERGCPLFRRAFEEFGVDVLGGDQAAVGATLRRRVVVKQIVGGLLDWAYAAQARPESSRVLQVVLSVDDDPRHMVNRIIRANGAQDIQALKRLATEAEADLPPAAVVMFLARSLRTLSAIADAEKVLRVSQRRYPGNFWLTHDLGATLIEMRPDHAAEALRFQTAALGLRPLSPGAQLNVGVVLQQCGRSAEAESAYRRAIELKPDYAAAHVGLAHALSDQGQHVDAEAACRRAVDVDPRDVLPHLHLGIILRRAGRYSEAEAAYRQAIELRADDADIHTALSVLFAYQKRYTEAEAACRRAIELKPDFASADINLGAILVQQKRYAEAEVASRRALELAPRSDGGNDNLGDALRGQERYAEAVAHYAREIALGLDASRYGESPRYAGARAAARAGCGEGKDAGALGDAERARLRQQALEWLTAELASWAKRAEAPEYQATIRQTLQQCQENSDFAGVRAAAALAKLPEAERAVWKKFWADVVELQKRCQAPPAPTKPKN
jgi:serine/threonine protein kinase/Flp pilus assembly protein TadD